MSDNRNLNDAARANKDEFYTQIEDIEKEMRYYREHFKGKTILCNCDDPRDSHFWRYFAINFDFLGLKKLIATHYDAERPTYKLELFKDITGDGKINEADIIETPLKTNGDFRSPECIEILKEADIVVTNPPFSLFIPYFMQLMEYDKKFIIIGNLNAVKYKDIFPYFIDGKVWLGQSIHSGDRWFRVPDHYPLTGSSTKIEGGRKFVKVKGVRWFTNLDFPERHEDIILYKKYNLEEYPHYLNYDGIEVSETKNIPMDYDGVMGVPISFIDRFNPDQFELLGSSERLPKTDDVIKAGACYIMQNEKPKRLYTRFFIRRK